MKFLSFFVLFAVLNFSAVSSYAKGPVVVEFFGQNECADDFKIQLRVHELLKNRQDIIFVNCRTDDYFKKGSAEEEQEQALRDAKKRAKEEGLPLYFNEFCTKKAEDYSFNARSFLSRSLLMMINGRWIANVKDMLPAINLGSIDNLADIALEREGDILHITLPESLVGTDVGEGVIRLFAYASGTDMDDKEVESSFLRPVFAMEEIGVWDGVKRNYDFSLAEISGKAGLELDEVGYVVILQKPDRREGVMPIIAAGEI